ncbi:MAG: hypothetical protein ACD_46C00607G0001 [uncultured bacterium]|nr:MAG: hypothetical protein ACD_46C00607G0001 [uncultured bacterium]
MQKKFFILLILCISIINCAFAVTQQPHEKITFNVYFNWQDQQNSKQHPFKNIHMNKTILLDPNDQDYKIVFTKSKMLEKKLPMTFALLVKILNIDSEKADLQFEVLEYGFSQGTIWAQPRLILKNAQIAEITILDHESNQPYLNLKVSGKWL